VWQKTKDKPRSEEFVKLDNSTKKPYLSQISILDDVDPYTLKGSNFSERIQVFCQLLGRVKCNIVRLIL